MPELFRFYGFVFFFFSREHEPIHVHVEGNGGMVIFDYDQHSGNFVLREKANIKSNDLKRIKEVIDENSDIIVKGRNILNETVRRYLV